MIIVQLMNSPAGRAGRAVAGLVLIAAGTAAGGLVLAVIGLVPLGAGASGRCLAAPLFRVPVRAR
jgi:hypothetical protein